MRFPKTKAYLGVGIGFVSFSDSQNHPDVAVTAPAAKHGPVANICCLFTLAGGAASGAACRWPRPCGAHYSATRCAEIVARIGSNGVRAQAATARLC